MIIMSHLIERTSFKHIACPSYVTTVDSILYMLGLQTEIVLSVEVKRKPTDAGFHLLLEMLEPIGKLIRLQHDGMYRKGWDD